MGDVGEIWGDTVEIWWRYRRDIAQGGGALLELGQLRRRALGRRLVRGSGRRRGGVNPISPHLTPYPTPTPTPTPISPLYLPYISQARLGVALRRGERELPLGALLPRLPRLRLRGVLG